MALGLLGRLGRLETLIVTLFSLFLIVFSLRHSFKLKSWLKILKEIIKDKLLVLIVALLIIQVLINFLGAISPEISFDALWYHLTPAKLYAQNQRIFHLPGWLLSVSSLPRFTEMFYSAALVLGDEIWAKLIHFSFGILAALALFNLLKRYFSLRISFLGVLTFNTMLVVGWQSTVAYVDLAWTFFEILALDNFLQWREKRKESYLHRSALLVGLAIATKIFAFGSLLTFLFLILILRGKGWLRRVFRFGIISLLVTSPWLVLSWVNVGNPLFPLFGSPTDVQAINVRPGVDWLIVRLMNFPSSLWRATFQPDDIISPVYLLFFPLILYLLWRQKQSLKISFLYFLLGSFLVPAASNRYLLPYLAALTLPLLAIFNYPWKKRLLTNLFIIIIIFSALLNLGSRGLATKKFIPYLLRQETKAEFLAKNLNFSFGEFYDVDGFFSKNIQNDDLVLIYGIHNLFYVDFPYVHESWAKPGTFFTHILVGGNQNLPEKFGKRLLIYENPETRVRFYVFGEKYQ